MRLELDTAHEDFRQEVRDFIRANLTPEMTERRGRSSYNAFKVHDDMLRWTAILSGRGWSVPSWPVVYGGRDWTPLQHFIFREEQYAADCPSPNVQGTNLVGPIVYLFGDEAQKARFLPGIREGRSYWCQGFSEPEAGSDLASLRTSAVLEGGRWLVNGQKIWTSGAYDSDWGFFLVRTDASGKKQDGISFLMIDMQSPGITVRQIPSIHGDAHLCEVFLDNVEVPAENLIGTPGQGWTYAKALLNLERTEGAFIYSTKRELRRLRDLAAREGLLEGLGHRGYEFRRRIARAEAMATGLEWSVLRVLGQEPRPYPPGPIASALKLRGADLQQMISELETDLLGAKGVRAFTDAELLEWHSGDAYWHDEVPGRTFAMLYCRAASIFAGARQVQSDIIAQTAFELR
ncbi:MAG: acyl-CoA dehydrogenase family protein [Pseudomonadota bacterium]